MQISKLGGTNSFYLLAAFLLAQQNTISPHSSFGVGEPQEQEFSLNNALGGVGVALRAGNYLNPTNPASLTAINTTVLNGITGTASYLTDNFVSRIFYVFTFIS